MSRPARYRRAAVALPQLVTVGGIVAEEEEGVTDARQTVRIGHVRHLRRADLGPVAAPERGGDAVAAGEVEPTVHHRSEPAVGEDPYAGEGTRAPNAAVAAPERSGGGKQQRALHVGQVAGIRAERIVQEIGYAHRARGWRPRCDPSCPSRCTSPRGLDIGDRPRVHAGQGDRCGARLRAVALPQRAGIEIETPADARGVGADDRPDPLRPLDGAVAFP